ncbi:MAG: SRPBCC family protein [Flavobacteriaceae bacterium]|nr:SRPBCC family protein [Flavobacteriaceae bacterium]
MKYTSEIIVKLLLKEFLEKMDNAENMKHWQKGLVEYNQIGGTPGELGAKMKLSYKFKKREMELIETITHKKLPNEFHMTYETKGMFNKQENYFEQTPEGHTKWTSIAEFIPENFIMKIITPFMKGAFKKQTMNYMRDFKNFAEKGTSVANA